MVIRRFLGDQHVVDVALTQALGRDANELRFLMHLRNRAATRVSHARLKSSDQLSQDRSERSAVRNPSFDPFGY